MLPLIPLEYPFDAGLVLRKCRGWTRQLRASTELLEKRIAILGGSTTAGIREVLEVFLLHSGIRPTFYESEHNRYYEEAVFPNPRLQDFRPDVVYLHVTEANLDFDSPENLRLAAIGAAADRQLQRFAEIWDGIDRQHGCLVVQNNFELPAQSPLGSMDATCGRVQFIEQVNQRLHASSETRAQLKIHDLHSLAAWFGLRHWHDARNWFAYDYAPAPGAIPYLAHSLTGLLRAVWGKNRKCAVVDLDNTLWGGVIGDDGVEGITVGEDSPQGRAFCCFQRYLKGLKERGVLLAVCSQNDEQLARGAFSHPGMVLRLDDFQTFVANWEPKAGNLQAIAAALNIDLESLVFLDDNPAERELIRVQHPQVAVPEIGDDPAGFVEILDRNRYFELSELSAEDLQRNQHYQDSSHRQRQQGEFTDYTDFLKSLGMRSEIRPFSAAQLPRITQLINKTNQFNLTTRRYTAAEVQAAANGPNCLTLSGRLIDRFGDNGLVSVVLANRREDVLEIDAWLMSCRVFKRGLEFAMFEELVRTARERGVGKILGVYRPTPKNALVAEFYGRLGFEKTGSSPDGATHWQYRLATAAALPPHFIRIER